MPTRPTPARSTQAKAAAKTAKPVARGAAPMTPKAEPPRAPRGGSGVSKPTGKGIVNQVPPRASAKVASKTANKSTTTKAKPAAKSVTARTMPAKPPATRRPPTPPKLLENLVAEVRKYANGRPATILSPSFEERGAVTAYGGKWYTSLKAYLVFGDVRPELARYASEPMSWERWIQDEINQVHAAYPTRAVMKPRRHQAIAIKKIEQAAQAGFRGFAEADNVGLGKTLASLLGASAAARVRGFTATNPAKLLVVCPKSVIPHWRNTIRNSGADNLRVCVINYDQSLKLLSIPEAAAKAKRQKTKNSNTASKGRANVAWDVIIADESHKLKNQSAQRSRAFDRIARYADAAERAPFVVWASATMGQNPVELGYLAPLFGQLTGAKNLTSDTWGKYLMDNGYAVSEGKVGYNWLQLKPNASLMEKLRVSKIQNADIDRLSKLLFNATAPSIRRNPTDIAGWPEIQRILFPVALDNEQRRLYKQAWLAFRQEMKMLARGNNPKSGLVAQLRFRQKASLLLVPSALDLVEDLLENGHQVAVSTQFIETIDRMRPALEKAGYRVAEISGRLGDADRENERLRFQRGEADVVFYTIVEGISLHAGELLPDGSTATATPRANVVVDIRYSAIESSQLEGRTHRDGQNANVYYMYPQRTVVEKILKVMITRMKHLSSLSGDDPELTAKIEALLNEDEEGQ